MHDDGLRLNVTKECLLEWFGDLRQYLITAGHPYLLDDPTIIYNANESAFPLSMKSSRVVDVTKTKKYVYQGGSALSKTTITVMLATSAAGHYIRPMVVYSGVQPRQNFENISTKSCLMRYLRIPRVDG